MRSVPAPVFRVSKSSPLIDSRCAPRFLAREAARSSPSGIDFFPMAEAQRDLGPLNSLETEAIGEPGQRRFRLRLIAHDEVSASLWLEKEQVDSLATAIRRVLAQNQRPGEGGWPNPRPLAVFPLAPDIDFQIARLALGYDESNGAFALYAVAIDDTDAPHPTLRAAFSREQARLFAAQAESTVAAGRPLCPLCDTPLVTGKDEPHLCPPSNGHSDDALAWIPDL